MSSGSTCRQCVVSLLDSGLDAEILAEADYIHPFILYLQDLLYERANQCVLNLRELMGYLQLPVRLDLSKFQGISHLFFLK